MGFFSNVDNREKRQDCPNCGGLGKVIEVTSIKNRDGTRDSFRDRVKCRKCKGSGLK